MPGPRVLAVTDDAQEWQALSRELDARFELVRASGHSQAMGVIEREGELHAIVAFWGPLTTGPDLMRDASRRRPKLVRVLIAPQPPPEAQALVSSSVVRAVVADASQ